MSLLRGLRVEHHRRSVRGELDRRWCPGRPLLDAAQQLFETLGKTLPDPPAHPDDDPLGPVPGVEVGRERLARRRLDRLLRPENVPAERLVGVQEPVVDVSDVALRGVEIDVHLLEDHALLLLDLGRVEAGVEEHVGEDVECDVPGSCAALHVVAGDFLTGESVELAADRVDLRRDRARRRAALRALEEHVLGEVRDPLGLGGLVARTGREHDEAGDRSHLRHRCGNDADAIAERHLLEHSHSVDGIDSARARTADPKGHRRAARVASAGLRPGRR